MKKLLFRIIILIVVVVIIGLLYFLIKEEDEVPEDLSEEEVAEEDIEQKPGDTGEVWLKDEESGEEERLVTPTIPPVIFSTSGIILEKKSDSLIIAGSGYNFADQTPRNLTCIFTDKTLTFTKNQVQRYSGQEGLKYLEQGMKVLISSDENIRGKTEFKIKTINIL